jgi:hypothetical protein
VRGRSSHPPAGGRGDSRGRRVSDSLRGRRRFAHARDLAGYLAARRVRDVVGVDLALLFNGTVYYRGGMTLQALREKIGDLVFFSLLRTWATQNRYGTVTTPQFIALAEKISGQDLTQFFKVWIYQADKPAPGSW